MRLRSGMGAQSGRLRELIAEFVERLFDLEQRQQRLHVFEARVEAGCTSDFVVHA